MACASALRRRGDNQGMSELPAPSALPLKLLAIETSTDRLSVALGTGAHGEGCLAHEGPGAAQASATLLPVVRGLLAQGGWALAELDALVASAGCRKVATKIGLEGIFTVSVARHEPAGTDAQV